MKKNLYSTDIISSRETGAQQEIKEEAEKEQLADYPQDLDQSVFFRAFFFQSLFSPGSLFLVPFHWQAAESAFLQV